jgi:hypothetical protein
MTTGEDMSMYLNMAQLHDAIAMMRSLCGEGCRFQNHNQLAEFLELGGNDKANFYKILKGTTRPRADRLLAWLEKLGFTVLPPWEKPVDARKELLERADAAMTAMSELGISDSDRACIHDVFMGRGSHRRNHIQRAAGDR